LITVKDIDKAKDYPFASKDARGRLLVGAAVGVDKTSLDRIKALVDVGVDVIVIDSAHGHSDNVLRQVKLVKSLYPSIQLVAGQRRYPRSGPGFD
jgi:IMP dehydrogenase